MNRTGELNMANMEYIERLCGCEELANIKKCKVPQIAMHGFLNRILMHLL